MHLCSQLVIKTHVQIHLFGLGIVVMMVTGNSISIAQQTAIGIEYGPTYNFQFGSEGQADPTAGTTGMGWGYLASVMAEMPLNHGWVVGLHVGYYKQMVHGVYENPQSNTGTTYISFRPEAALQIYRGFYAAAGFDFAFLVNNRVRTWLRNAAWYDDPSDFVDHTIPDPKSIRFGILPSLGWNLDFGGVVMTPNIGYNVPLTSISEDGTLGWRIASLMIAMTAKYTVN